MSFNKRRMQSEKKAAAAKEAAARCTLSAQIITNSARLVEAWKPRSVGAMLGGHHDGNCRSRACRRYDIVGNAECFAGICAIAAANRTVRGQGRRDPARSGDQRLHRGDPVRQMERSTALLGLRQPL